MAWQLFHLLNMKIEFLKVCEIPSPATKLHFSCFLDGIYLRYVLCKLFDGSVFHETQ